eukprot:gene14010-biopygen2734
MHSKYSGALDGSWTLQVPTVHFEYSAVIRDAPWQAMSLCVLIDTPRRSAHATSSAPLRLLSGTHLLPVSIRILHVTPQHSVYSTALCNAPTTLRSSMSIPCTLLTPRRSTTLRHTPRHFTVYTCSMVLHGAPWCSTVLHGAPRCPATLRVIRALRGTPRHSAALRGTPRHSAALRGTPRHSAALRGTPRHSAALRGTPRHSAALRGTPRHSAALR